MQAKWWQGGLHLNPESQEDGELLEAFLRLLDVVRVSDEVMSIPGTADGNNHEAIIEVN